MLPFLKPKPVGGVAVTYRKPDEKQSESEPETGKEAVLACAADLLKAVETKDVKLIAAALCAAHEILDSMPHEEGPHEE